MTLPPVRVVKIGGRAQTDAALPASIVAAANAGPICIVHGGGDEVSALQRRLGLEPRFIGGRRVTTETDLDIVRMVLSGTANKRLVAAFAAAGVRAVGISGEDANLFRSRVTEPQMGRVGSEVEVDAAAVRALLASGFVPVISPLAIDADDPARSGLNVNGDDAAAALAAALGADDLVFVADVPGVLDAGTVIPALDVAAAEELIRRGVAAGGMAAKLQAASRALAGGVVQVRISGIAGIGEMQGGTRITRAGSTATSTLR